MGSSKDRELDPLRQEAIGWVRHLTSGQVTRADAEALKRWRGQSPAHATAFREASGLWRDIGPAGRNLRAMGQAAPSLARVHPVRRGIDRRAVLGGGLAVAAAASYAVIHPPLDLWPGWAELTADYRTATGEQREIALADDVAIRLNTRTSISIGSSGGGTDRVRLIAGEASFVTPPDAARALIVFADAGRSIAQGARFDVRRLGSSTGSPVCITCLEGNVRVEQRGAAIVVGAGQQLRYDAAQVSPIVAVDPRVVSSWQRGILIFQFTPLAEVVAEINRYRPGRVILLNDVLGRSPVSGRFSIDRMDEIFPRIEQAFGAKVRRLPGGIVLLS